MQYLIHLFLLLLLLTFIVHENSAQPPYTTLVAPLLKHTKHSVYSINLYGELYLIDLDAPYSWMRCKWLYPFPVACSSPQCLEAWKYVSPLCPPDANSTSIPPRCWPCTEDCYNDNPVECEDRCNGCTVTPVNPVARTCALAHLTYKDLILYWTNGTNPISAMNFNQLYVSCAPPSLLKSLPSDILGVASLSWSSLGLTSQFFIDEVMAKNFAICLPSSSRPHGVTFFGDGPYHFLPSNIDVKSLLSYTSLIKNPKSPGYYIKTEGISVGGKGLPISLGNMSYNVKLSTAVPYTTVRSDIYKHFISRFSKGVKDIPRVPSPVKSLSLCFNASAIGLNRVGLRVPRIDLQLGNGSIWSIYGPNSMQKFGNNVACLGIVDGGDKPEDAVVIGSYQLENNFLFFDLEKSLLGFSSTLLLNGTSCSNFNFTVTPWP